MQPSATPPVPSPQKLPAHKRAIPGFTPFPVYQAGSADMVSELGHGSSIDAIFLQVTGEIIAAEGPTRLDRLMRLTFSCFGIRDARSIQRARLHALLPSARIMRDPISVFLWPEHFEPQSWREFRRTVKQGDRSLSDITIHEVANALTHTLEPHRDGIEFDVLLRETLATLGYSRVSGQTYSHMVLAAELVVRERRAHRRGMTFFPLRQQP